MLMPPAFHYIEAWNERVCDGAWGKRFEKYGEKLRRGFDLEHWAAWHHSFERITELVRSVASGERGGTPATVIMLGGDIHHAYLADVQIPGAKSAVWQAVCSPFRNPLEKKERVVARLGASRGLTAIVRRIARSAGVPDPPLSWELVQPPTFDNQFATLEIEGRSVRMKIERTVPGDWKHPKIDTTLERRLS
jgi:hypothetical protein